MILQSPLMRHLMKARLSEMALCPGELPPELCVRPTAFVALTGLDVIHNAVHKAVWDSFSANRRPDRVPIAFKVLDGDYEYPKMKQKRTSYEWFVPKGFLKTNWMNKHLSQVPALVVVFYDLDWDDPMWAEKKMECASKVEVVRSSLDGRNTKVSVVLIQKNTPLPPGEDMVAADRATQLCSACDLSAKSLFLLSHTDHLLGYTLRLENAFYELAQNYYHLEIRRVKSHYEHLNKTTHQLLYVRHQFKVAFFNEMKQDIATALKHYKQAYANIMEVRATDTNRYEVKTLAGFVNYKICRLSFQMNTPLDAISHFRKHIDIFKNKVGPRELAFEHSAWMSKQFSIFGDLFDEAIKLGLSAIQTQHPGFYYQQAAYHSITRKLLCQELCRGCVDATYPPSDPLDGKDDMEYYGQRPWRPAIQSLEPPDMDREREGILALQIKESTGVNHSMIIIPLLSSAVTQFKKYKCPRMKRFLLVQMGEEYYHMKDYSHALTLLSHVMWDYRWERWWRLLQSIQRMALRCAYLVVSIQEYVTLSIEVLSKWIQFSPDDKERMQLNLFKAIAGEVPTPEPGCPSECTQQAASLWLNFIQKKEPTVFTVEMNNLIPFVDCQAWFAESSCLADRLIVVEVCIREASLKITAYLDSLARMLTSCEQKDASNTLTSCPLATRFSKLSVLFSNQHYNQFCILQDSKASSPLVEREFDSNRHGELVVEPGRPKFFTFSFVAQAQDLNKNVEIVGIVLQLGNDSKCCAVLHWSIGSGDSTVQRPMWSPWRNQSYWQVEGDALPTQVSTRILPRESCMRICVQHEPPALANEFYAFRFVFTNNEPSMASDIVLSLGLKDEQELMLEQTTHLSLDEPSFNEKVVSRLDDIELMALPPGGTAEKTVYMKTLQTGTRPIFLKISYNVEVKVGEQTLICACTKEEEFVVPTVKPFDVTVKQMTMMFDRLEQIRVKEPFLMMTEILCSSPWPVDIHTSSVELNQTVESVDEKLISQLENVELQNGDKAAECFCLIAKETSEQPVALGKYTLIWKRKNSSSKIPYVATSVCLPSTTVVPTSLYMEVDLPAHGWMRTPLLATYTLYNRTMLVQDFDLNMESSEAFMFAGQKQLHFRIMPDSEYKLTYNLYPLIAGYVALPRPRLSLTRHTSLQPLLDNLIEKQIPAHIFIMPQRKTLNDCEDLTS